MLLQVPVPKVLAVGPGLPFEEMSIKQFMVGPEMHDSGLLQASYLAAASTVYVHLHAVQEKAWMFLACDYKMQELVGLLGKINCLSF